MIKELIVEAALRYKFVLFEGSQRSERSIKPEGLIIADIEHESLTYLSQHNGDSKRFLAIVECTKLPSAPALNKLVLSNAPEAFKADPAFDKNTDLIVLHKLMRRSDFNDIETKVFSIEENPYYFKKYFLYYSEEELRLLEGHSFDSISAVVISDSMFAEYRDNPLMPTTYSVAARIFIKLPFIKIPVKESSLKPLDIYVDEALSEKKLTDLYSRIFSESTNEITAIQLIENLIHEEMENIQPED